MTTSARAIRISERLKVAALKAVTTLGTTMTLREYATAYSADTNVRSSAPVRTGTFSVSPLIDRSQSLRDDAPDYDAYAIAAAANAPFAPSTKCVLEDPNGGKWHVTRVVAYNPPTNVSVAWRLELKRV